jgi:hypothetical protein
MARHSSHLCLCVRRAKRGIGGAFQSPTIQPIRRPSRGQLLLRFCMVEPLRGRSLMDSLRSATRPHATAQTAHGRCLNGQRESLAPLQLLTTVSVIERGLTQSTKEGVESTQFGDGEVFRGSVLSSRGSFCRSAAPHRRITFATDRARPQERDGVYLAGIALKTRELVFDSKPPETLLADASHSEVMPGQKS